MFIIVSALFFLQMSLDDLMLITDNRLQLSGLDVDGNLDETTFSDLNNAVKCQLTDPKLEKKVTFARLMSKVTAELSSGSEVDAEIVNSICSIQSNN